MKGLYFISVVLLAKFKVKLFGEWDPQKDSIEYALPSYSWMRMTESTKQNLFKKEGNTAVKNAGSNIVWLAPGKCEMLQLPLTISLEVSKV